MSALGNGIIWIFWITAGLALIAFGSGVLTGALWILFRIGWNLT